MFEVIAEPNRRAILSLLPLQEIDAWLARKGPIAALTIRKQTTHGRRTGHPE
jgi:hypothetical protein